MSRTGRLETRRPDHPAANAERLNRAGNFGEALAEIDALLSAEPASTKYLRVKHQALMGLRRFGEAVEVIERACSLQPHNRHYRKMHAIALKDSGDDAAALPLLEALRRESDEDLDVLGALTVAYFRLGDEASSLQCGQRKLDLLMERTPSVETVIDRDPSDGANIVAYSLWGAARQYCEGALVNARRLPQLLPGWIARFYVDSSVPADVIGELRNAGAQLVDCSHDSVPPLMWRFLVHDDPSVSRYLVRDSDSRLSAREVAAIDDWLASGLGFHAMRDHPFHTELMMGGLWGGTARNGFSMRGLIATAAEQAGGDHRYGADQHFLGHYVWSRVRHGLLTHDSYYSGPGVRPYPDRSRGTDSDHIGMGLVIG